MDSKVIKEFADATICSLLDLNNALIDAEDKRRFDTTDILNKLILLFPDGEHE